MKPCRNLLLTVFFAFAACVVARAEDDVAVEAAVEVNAVAVMGMQADPLTARLQQNLAVQRAFISRVCKLTDDQKTKLASMNNVWLDKLRNQVPAKAQNPGLIGMFFGVQAQRPAVAQHKNIQNRVDKELIGLLDEEQKLAFEKAKEERLAFRSEATTEGLIEALQERLDLTDEQRKKIKKKMIPWVSRQDDIVLLVYFSGGNYYPQIPIHLLDALTDEQRAIYQGLQRHLFTSENFNDGNAPIMIEE